MKLQSAIAGAALIAGTVLAVAAPAQAAISQTQDGTTCVPDHREYRCLDQLQRRERDVENLRRV
ncbi:hypothetical protein [Micromonospora sp. RTGN7]|uniref:hypothetical protein n=1 Tax=Micromonospora sp. RTGN7 TaxID=3016526 RepID=UPI0029FF46CA|nr:hypothetical protein [Micromonospora sp. RTGN7]